MGSDSKAQALRFPVFPRSLHSLSYKESGQSLWVGRGLYRVILRARFVFRGFELAHHGVRNLFLGEITGGAKRSGSLLLMVSHLLSHFGGLGGFGLSVGGLDRRTFAGK